MFNKKGFKKAGLCIVTALVIMGTSGCNTKIKPNYGYNPTDHVELGQYKGIEYSVDEEGIEKDIIKILVQLVEKLFMKHVIWKMYMKMVFLKKRNVQRVDALNL